MSTSRGIIYITALLAIIARHPSHALRCYSCSYVVPDSDKACVENPKLVIGQATVNCLKKYCVIQRKELLNSSVINTFYRGCEDKPLYINAVIRDTTYKTYFRSCTKDLCNSGFGNSSSSSDSNSNGGDNLFVKGKNAGNSMGDNLYISLILFISVRAFLI